MESAHGGAGDSYYGDQLDWAAGGRHRGDEHHADFRDRTNTGDRRAKGDWSAAGGHTAAVFAGSGGAHAGGRHYRHPDWGRNILDGTNVCALGSCNAVLLVGDHRLSDFGQRGLVLRLLPGKSCGESGSHQLPALRMTSMRVFGTILGIV